MAVYIIYTAVLLSTAPSCMVLLNRRTTKLPFSYHNQHCISYNLQMSNCTMVRPLGSLRETVQLTHSPNSWPHRGHIVLCIWTSHLTPFCSLYQWNGTWVIWFRFFRWKSSSLCYVQFQSLIIITTLLCRTGGVHSHKCGWSLQQ